MVSVPLNEEPSERYYVNVADVGVGGQVVDIVNNSSKSLGGVLSFFLAGLRATLFQYKNAPLHLELDGRIICTGVRHYFVAVANGRYFGGGMHIAPNARLDDGLLDIVLVGDLTLPEKVYFASKLYSGKAGKLRKVQMLRGHRLSIRSPHKVFIEADGELVGTTDAHFEVLPSALNVLGLTPRSVP
jgi:diacylglycerol kinase family enzyme